MYLAHKHKHAHTQITSFKVNKILFLTMKVIQMYYI